jgi:rare lipoprotein A (peptidoglycan hydrolase)
MLLRTLGLLHPRQNTRKATVARVGLSIVLLLVFTRCSTHKYPVEGVSRSSKAYYLRGQWHYPQKYYDYNKVGLASWYGPNCHGKQKAQGEIYDQYAMTAAHKTLPLPTIAKVTNLENNKSVVVMVDDRGPYKYKGRIIDLSISAAKELGMYSKGIAKVRVQSLPPESHAFSMYLKNHCGKLGNKTNGQSWEDIYRQNVGAQARYKNLTNICSKVHESNMVAVSNAQNIRQQNVCSSDNTRSKNNTTKRKNNTKKKYSSVKQCIQLRIQQKHKGAHPQKRYAS